MKFLSFMFLLLISAVFQHWFVNGIQVELNGQKTPKQEHAHAVFSDSYLPKTKWFGSPIQNSASPHATDIGGSAVVDSRIENILKRFSDKVKKVASQNPLALSSWFVNAKVSEDSHNFGTGSRNRSESLLNNGKALLGYVFSQSKSALKNILQRGQDPRIHVLANNVLVASVPRKSKKPFLLTGKPSVAVTRAVFYNRTLIVEVREMLSIRALWHLKTSNPQEGPIDEYAIPLADKYPDLGNIKIVPNWWSSYNVYIPLISVANKEHRNLDPNLRIEASWKLAADGGHLEEDLYEFLNAQMYCKSKFRGQGLNASICACEKMHSETGSEKLTACIARIVDRTHRMVAKLGEKHVAKQIYENALSCRIRSNVENGYILAKDCLVNILQSSVLVSSSVHARQMRVLLSSFDNEAVLSTVDQHGTSYDASAIPPLSVRTIAVLVYFIGMVILFFGLADITRHYRRHRLASVQREQFMRLPPSARYLYSPLL